MTRLECSQIHQLTLILKFLLKPNPWNDMLMLLEMFQKFMTQVVDLAYLYVTFQYMDCFC